MNAAQLLWMFIVTAIHAAVFVLLLFWFKRRQDGAPPAAPDKVPMPDFRDAAAPAPAIPPDMPYRHSPPLTPEDRLLAAALEELHGPDYLVYPRVAAGVCVVPTKDDPGYLERTRGHWFDFLICDRLTGAVVTALLVRRGGKARPDEYALIQACGAAELPLTVLDDRLDPTPEALREAMGWPEEI